MIGFIDFCLILFAAILIFSILVGQYRSASFFFGFCYLFFRGFPFLFGCGILFFGGFSFALGSGFYFFDYFFSFYDTFFYNCQYLFSLIGNRFIRVVFEFFCSRFDDFEAAKFSLCHLQRFTGFLCLFGCFSSSFNSPIHFILCSDFTTRRIESALDKRTDHMEEIS